MIVETAKQKLVKSIDRANAYQDHPKIISDAFKKGDSKEYLKDSLTDDIVEHREPSEIDLNN